MDSRGNAPAEPGERWAGLFADLDAQAEALERAELGLEIAERTRIERASINLAERLLPSLGSAVAVRCRGGVDASGVLRRLSAQWWLIQGNAGMEILVASSAVIDVRGAGRYAARAPSGAAAELVRSGLGLRHALRAVARDRSSCTVHLADGRAVNGTIDGVGRDFVELAAHPAGELRRRSEVRELLLVSIDALVALRRLA